MSRDSDYGRPVEWGAGLTGTFKAWSMDADDIGRQSYPVAIVENADGNVHAVYVKNLRFTDVDDDTQES